MSAFDPRVGCSSISFRHLTLPAALDVIAGLGFAEIDLGALPGVCDHVPHDLTAAAVDRVVGELGASGLAVRSVNGDIGDLNRVLDGPARRRRETHLARLLELAARVHAPALVLPCGAQEHQPVRTLAADLDLVARELSDAAGRGRASGIQIWTESLHVGRLCHDVERAVALHDRLDPAVGVVMDFSHVTASGGDVVAFAQASAERIRHVHVRDAVPGCIHLSVGRGTADFAGGIAALAEVGYAGHYALELETRDVTDAERRPAAEAAGRFVTGLLATDVAA